MDYSEQVWAFIGDSLTDGFVWPTIVLESLESAGFKLPKIVNAASAGMDSGWMLAHVQDDVTPYRPTLAFVHSGANDWAKGALEQLEDNIRGILTHLATAEVQPYVLLSPNTGRPWKLIDGALRRAAASVQARVVDCASCFAQANPNAGPLHQDGIHPTLRGHAIMARAVLDAMHHEDVPLDDRYTVKPHPGIIGEWKLLGLGADEPSPSPEALAVQGADGRWKTLRLPETEPLDDWWLDGERRRGFAIGLQRYFPGATRFYAISTIQSDADRTAWLNTGVSVAGVWLNGRQVFAHRGNPSWHAGRERVQVNLARGDNRIVVLVAGDDVFFLSLTDEPIWPAWEQP